MNEIPKIEVESGRESNISGVVGILWESLKDQKLGWTLDKLRNDLSEAEIKIGDLLLTTSEALTTNEIMGRLSLSEEEVNNGLDALKGWGPLRIKGEVKGQEIAYKLERQ